MARYIDVDNAVKEAINACNKIFRENGSFLTSIDAVNIAEALDEILAADVVEVKHGRYITNDDGDSFCSICGEMWLNVAHNFCPKCGAKMDGGRENDGKG